MVTLLTQKNWTSKERQEYLIKRKKYRLKNKVKIKEYYLKNKNIILKKLANRYKNLTNEQKRERYKKRKIWISQNREKYLAGKRRYRLNNAAKIKSYSTKNKKRINALALKRYHNYKKDPDFKKRRINSVMLWKKKNPEKVKSMARLYYAKNRVKLAKDNYLKKRKTLW